MIFLALGLLHQCVAKTCPDGWSIGINSYGAPDPMNVDRCYPTADMAKVASCVGSDGMIKVEVHVKKELGDKPDGFSDLDDNTWSRVFEVSEMGKSGTSDHLYLMRNIHIPGKSVIYRGLRIQKTVAVNLMFLCQYSLKERDIREDFSVTGQDALESRKSTGSLKYRLRVVDDDMLIGDQINFEVIPINPGVVFALVTRCYVVRGMHQLTIFGEDGNFCYNPYVGFEIVSGFNSQSVQHFRYNAFKWSVDKAETAPENQGLLCRIQLKGTAFEEVEPHVCDQTQPLMETVDVNKSNKGQGAQDRQMIHDFTGFDEEEEEEEKEEIELGPCSKQPFKVIYRNTRLAHGGRMEDVTDKQKRGSIEQCASRCLRKSGCGAFNYHVASETCAYKGIPHDNEYEKNDKKGYNGYVLRDDCRRPIELELVETTTMTTTTGTTTTGVTTTWLPTTYRLPEMCRGMNAAALVLPGQVFAGSAKNGRLSKGDFFGTEEECIKLCANMENCGGFLYMIEYAYCEFRHKQTSNFEFAGEEQVEDAEKYTSYVLKPECMTKVAEIEVEEQSMETTTMYSQFWTTTLSTTTASPCESFNAFDEIKRGEVILGEIIHWKFPKEEHYGTPEQCLRWCMGRPSCGAFLYYPSYRYCEYKYASNTHHYIMNDSTAKYESYTLKAQCVREELYGAETTSSTSTIMPTEFAFPAR